jgi:hypothetical protein
MAQAGISQIVQAVKGSAVVADQEPTTADLSLEALALRLAQLEAQQGLLQAQTKAAEGAAGDYKALLEQAVREKEAAEEGMRASLEELQALREKDPMPREDVQRLVASMQHDAATNHKAKLAAWKDTVLAMPRGEVYNARSEPVPLTINGLTAVVNPGPNTLPSAYVDAWEDHLEAERYAQEMAGQLSGQVEFGQMENIIHGQRGTDDLTYVDERDWNEDLGAL